MLNTEQERSIDCLHRLGTEVLASALELLPDAAALGRAVRDADGRVVDMRLVWINHAARARQPDPDAAIGGLCSTLWPQMVRHGSFQRCMDVLTTGEPAAGELHWTEADSFQPAYYDYRATRVGEELLLWVLHDSSARLRKTLDHQARLDALQSQLLQAQKLEVIGHLAAGVAHDFSNILTVINAACDVLECDLQGTPSGPLVAEIAEASERAAALTRQLLAFSRPRALALVDLDLNDLVRGAERMLGRLLGSHVQLDLQLGPELWTVQVDRGLLEQVLLNLAINARDAMPTGGALRIETANERDAAAAAWVRLSVIDAGQGMPPEVAARIFEPFFTTKPASRGTGLGLATVQRVVDGLGGRIRVDSAPGKGTRFDILLPRSPAPDGARTPPDANTAFVPPEVLT
jgi:signal transduction histidine kinase